MSHRLTVPAQQIVKEFLRAADEVRETGAANFGPDGLAEEQIVDHVVGRRLPVARVVLPADAVGAADHVSPLVERLGDHRSRQHQRFVFRPAGKLQFEQRELLLQRAETKASVAVNGRQNHFLGDRVQGGLCGLVQHVLNGGDCTVLVEVVGVSQNLIVRSYFRLGRDHLRDKFQHVVTPTHDGLQAEDCWIADTPHA
jgi:hypothetical protein